MNTKANILLRKDQVNTKENNKNFQFLKKKLWSRRTTAKITMMGRKITVDENNIIKKIKRNNIREKKVVQVLKKEDELI